MKTNHPLLDRQTEVEVVDDSHEPWLLVRCKETDFHFIANPPKYDRLTQEFAWEKTHDEERARRNREEPVMAMASTVAKKIKFLVRPNRDKMFALAKQVLAAQASRSYRVLDVGCGNGHKFASFCERFRASGVDIVPIGIEVSAYLASESRSRFAAFDGEVIENNAIDGMASVESGSLDMVTMHSFLEHEAQPLPLLKTIRDALKPGGTVILKVPNYACWNRVLRGSRWPGFRFPDHVSYFTPATLQLLADQAGFRLLRQHLSDRLPTNDNMYAVLQPVGYASSLPSSGFPQGSSRMPQG